MPFKDPVKLKEYKRLYRLKKKEHLKEWQREYRQTEEGKKSSRIGSWKKRGILCFDYNLLYDIFINTTICELCNCELTIDRYPTYTTRCLDHDHSITDKFNIRYVLCHSCNSKLK